MSNLIVKDNILIEASHRLGEAEQRLILLAILKARSQCNTIEQLQGKTLIIHADDYIQTFGVDRTTAYRVLKKAVLGLFRAEWGYKFINAKGLTQVAYRRFIQSADYVDDGANVSFKFSDDTIPMLIGLEQRFTSYEIEQVAQLSSQYAMRLYEFFMQYLDKNAGKGWLDISLEDLRFRLGLLPTEYKTMSNFKNRVLDLSIQQINENTNLTASYEQKKQGRTIVGFSFKFKIKTQKQKQIAKPKNDERDPQTVDMFSGFTDLERQTIQERIDAHIKRLESKGEIVDEFHRRNIKNKAIKEKWGLDSLEQKQAKESLKQAKKEKIEKEKIEKIEKEEQAKQQEQNRKQVLIEKFESLSADDKKQILDEFCETDLAKLWRFDRNKNQAYLDPAIITWFYNRLGVA